MLYITGSAEVVFISLNSIHAINGECGGRLTRMGTCI